MMIIRIIISILAVADAMKAVSTSCDKKSR